MGWSIGFDTNWNRDVGYGVPAYCDAPGCMAEIDRGLAYVCGSDPFGGDVGCGLFFCGKHLYFARGASVCARCAAYRHSPYKRIAPEHPSWVHHKLNDPSWEKWRKQNPRQVRALRIALAADSLAKADTTRRGR